MYEKLTSIWSYVFNGLFSVGEDCFKTRKMTSLQLLWKILKSWKKDFLIRDYLCTNDTKYEGGSLACSVRKQPFFVIHIDQDLPIWFTVSVWICISWWQKKKDWFIDLKSYLYNGS